MKNKAIKKLSAAALAAVMAVSFAPTASLNVFANPADAGKVATGETITGTGDFTLSSCSAVTVNSTATGNVNIDLKGRRSLSPLPQRTRPMSFFRIRTASMIPESPRMSAMRPLRLRIPATRQL